jgi:hypothetical protein
MRRPLSNRKPSAALAIALVRSRRRRAGYGRMVCAAARDAGARAVVLNATPDGERLYWAEGFTRIGTGITYWHHLGCTT